MLDPNDTAVEEKPDSLVGKIKTFSEERRLLAFIIGCDRAKINDEFYILGKLEKGASTYDKLANESIGEAKIIHNRQANLHRRTKILYLSGVLSKYFNV